MPLTDDIDVGGLTVRRREHAVLVRGREIDLTSREFEIMMRLAEHPGWVFSADQLSDETDDADYSPESVSVHVSRLRHKLSTAGAGDVVETVRGFGYRLRRPDAEGDESATPLDAARSELRDAAWHLFGAVFDIEHAGEQTDIESATEALDEARHAMYRILAEPK